MGSLFLSKSGFLPYCCWNMLLDAFLKPLSSATYVPTITVAHIFINNHTSLIGRIGSASQQLEHQVKSAVQNCYGAVSPRLIFSSQCMLPAAKKDVLPANQRSMVIYEYVCHCDSRYVGRTTQRLQERIKQHVPTAIR